MDVRGKKFLVVGLGKSGAAAARLLLARGAYVTVNDVRDAEALGDMVPELLALGAQMSLGGHDAALFCSVDHIVVSPGVPPLAALDAAEAAGIPIASEVELASWFVSGTVVGITGTNGKSTVTSMIGEMCRRTGRPTFVGGNLGTPLVDVVGTPAAEADGYLVVELSSFQLERVSRFRAHVAVLLNVTEDHLDRYATFDDYARAKGRIFDGQTDADAAVVPAGDLRCEALAGRGRGAVYRFGTGGHVRAQSGKIVNGSSGLSLATADLKIAGDHNVANACAAALAARLAGVPVDAIEAALKDFRGLPHRMEYVGRVGDVTFLDDSKATNVGAAVAAIDGLASHAGKVVLIGGGKDKGGSYADLRDRLDKRGRAAVLIGEAAPLIEASLRGSSVPVVRATTMEDAVRRAQAVAQPGDVVLLAPACSSYDMFKSYAERGDIFKRAVLSLEGAQP